jgi:hypothetical protein
VCCLLVSTPAPRCPATMQEAVPKLGVASPRVLSNILWALAVLGYRPPDVTATHETPHARPLSSDGCDSGSGGHASPHGPSTPEAHLQSDPPLAVLMGRVLTTAPEFGPQVGARRIRPKKL